MMSRRKVAQFIAKSIFEGKSIPSLMASLGAYLIVTSQTKQADRYVDSIVEELSKHGFTLAKVTSARALDDELRDQIKGFVRDKSGSEHVTLREYIDAELIGGVVIDTPNGRFDSSVKTAIQHLTMDK